MDHARYVLAGIVPDRRDNLLHALQHLQGEHFRNEAVRNLFLLLERYYNVAADIMTNAALTSMLERSNVEASKQLLYEELFEEVTNQQVADHEFRYAIDALKDQRSHQLTGEAITTAFEVLERGYTEDGVEYTGHADARTYVYGRLAAIDKLNHAEASPEGDMRLEAEDALQEYSDRKTGKIAPGIKSGLPTLDNSTGGMQNGEVILACAYTGQGKSMISTQTAWTAAVEQGKNVFFATSETVRAQVMRRIRARHSRLPQFGYPRGLNVRDIKDGTLDSKGEEVYRAVLEDMATNPTYGHIYVAQIPRGATLGFVEARMQRQQTLWNIDLLVIDYLALLKPDRKRQTSREEFNDILKDAKTFATSFNDGSGVPLVSPWQMSQTAYREANRTGEYTLANLAETSEAEKSADQIWSILRTEDNPKEAKVQILKNRDGDTPPGFMVETAYHCAYLSERMGAGDDLASTGVQTMFDSYDADLNALLG